jgi:hypothetical protein
MVTRRTVKTAGEYARALIPHLEHEVYRCDQPHHGLMGKGCRTCLEETFIATDDFRANGDLEAFDLEMKPHEKKGKK